jgi:hypothetical protein
MGGLLAQEGGFWLYFSDIEKQSIARLYRKDRKTQLL